MARRPVSVFKRPMQKKGQFRYYIKIWNATTGRYDTARSAVSVATELGLDPKNYPPTSKAGAFLIAQEMVQRGKAATQKNNELLVDYCLHFWTWDTSSYVQGKLARGQRIGKEYVSNNLLMVEKHVRPAFPQLRLADVRPYMIENFVMKLKNESGLSHSAINGIASALKVPLHEAARLGLIDSDPAVSIHKLGNDTKEKGIPKDSEIRALLELEGLDLRVQAAILLGTTCAMRLGEILALKLDAIEGNVLKVSQSWSKVEGLKGTKTGRIRRIPLPTIAKNALQKLDKANPHGEGNFLFYGMDPEEPMNSHSLEDLFYSALEKIGIGSTERKSRNITFHSLRHWSNATLRGNVTDKTLRLLTGHSSEAMTDRYDHATEANLLELAQAQETKILAVLGV